VTTLPLEADPITLAHQDGGCYVVGAWPRLAAIAEASLRGGDLDTTLRWPYLTLRAANGQATYRVGTLERGVWLGELLEATGP